MTNKRRTKACDNCGSEFTEHHSDSDQQWKSRLFCSLVCSNRSTKRRRNIYDRLEAMQIKGEGCWGWRGTKDGGGYGMLSNRHGSGRSPETASRVSYEKHYGPIPKGMFVCHRCDNPECSNPDHLFLGTPKDNSQDCSRKGRLSPVSLLNLNHQKALTKGQVAEIQKIRFAALNGRGHGRLVKDVAKEYGVSTDLITAIKHRRYEGR